MRPVRYNVAASLDGYVAGPHGSFDWIPDDPTVDFAGLFAKIDTVLLGRKSYEVALDMGGELPWTADSRVFVFSSTLRPENHPEVTVVSDHAVERVRALREESGDGEIWLFGGGELFRTLLVGGQVDRVEVTVAPVLLGGGTPLLAPRAPQTQLTLIASHQYPSGMVALTYEVVS
jgi:dihydrofolate reductase